MRTYLLVSVALKILIAHKKQQHILRNTPPAANHTKAMLGEGRRDLLLRKDRIRGQRLRAFYSWFMIEKINQINIKWAAVSCKMGITTDYSKLNWNLLCKVIPLFEPPLVVSKGILFHGITFPEHKLFQSDTLLNTLREWKIANCNPLFQDVHLKS